MISGIYKRLKSIADNEFSDIVLNSEIIFSFSGRARKLRLLLLDATFIDIWYSLEGEYSYHWEQREFRDTIYRHDNAPHAKWASVKTFPKHCHNGTDDKVVESFIPDTPEEAIRVFVGIVREQLLELKSNKKRKKRRNVKSGDIWDLKADLEED